MNESIINKARGALRLSREGATAGERAAAKAALDRILARHDMEIADLETPETDWYPFTHNTHYEKSLLLHLYNRTTDGRETQYANGDGWIELRLRPDELEEITRVYDAYLAAWREDVDDLWRAFVLKNKLYAKMDAQGRTMSREDELKARLMARALRRVRVPLGTKRRVL